MNEIRIPDLEGRLRVLLTIVLGCFSLLLIRLFYLQIIRGDDLKRMAEANRTTLFFERAPRGLIYDREGRTLADNQPGFVVFFTPLEFKGKELEIMARKLSIILGEKEENLFKRLQTAVRNSSLIRIVDRASKSVAFQLLENQTDLPGISVDTEMHRRYPQGNMAAHLLGYLGKISPEELVKLPGGAFRKDQWIGKSGLEKNYDLLLHGEDGGMKMEVDARGHSLRVLEHREPFPGLSLHTTLDLEIQKVAEEALLETAHAGALVVLNPQNGEILALASSPSFDPNIFMSLPGEKKELGSSAGELVGRSDLPLFNRALQAAYAPGSVFKIVVLLAALENKKNVLQEEDYCKGHFWLEGPIPKKFLCWKEGGHGKVNWIDALTFSCNVYFYKLGLKCGPDLIESLAKQFRFGQTTGIELLGERKGYIPGRSMFKTGNRRWYDGDTVNMSIGQGTILVTPLQLAQFIGTVANHGKIFRPRLVKEIRKPSGELVRSTLPELVGEVLLSPETWNSVESALSQVVERGTGKASQVRGIRIAGKTGTVQNPHGPDHAWFVAYGPVENPRIALAVFVEHGGKGSVYSAQIAQKIFARALGHVNG